MESVGVWKLLMPSSTHTSAFVVPDRPSPGGATPGGPGASAPRAGECFAPTPPSPAGGLWPHLLLPSAFNYSGGNHIGLCKAFIPCDKRRVLRACHSKVVR
eukprot:4752187-Heterocapsa_arctica.AAC.1